MWQLRDNVRFRISIKAMNSTDPITPQTPSAFGKPTEGWRLRLYTIIFEADTPAGLRFDLILIAAILASILVVMLDSVRTMRLEYGGTLTAFEWAFTLLFTVEYIARLSCVQNPIRYATSFFGIIDLLSILPTYVSLLVPDASVFLDVRTLRLIRIFRVLKLTLYVAEYQLLLAALRASSRKVLVFISMVLMLVLILGTVMYVLEGPENGFTSIPMAMYWAVVTMTTVGYGDIIPVTDLGKVIASFVMLLGWGTLAVPTGIVTAEMASQSLGRRYTTTRTCHVCLSEGHEPGAKFCKDCSAELPEYRHA
jgi:voltage-gated potassium channel